jgi:hypothetical protein
MLEKSLLNQQAAFGCQFDNPNSAVSGMVLANNQPFPFKPVDGACYGTCRELYHLSGDVYRQRSFVEERLKDPKIGVAQVNPFDACFSLSL